MPSYTVKLRSRADVAKGTMAFHFEKPVDFPFQAGQFLEIALKNPPETDAEGNVRAFTIASAPFEPDLIIATRMRDTAFKRVLKTMPLGSEVAVDGAFGELVLEPNASAPAVFLAGGIGITPFRSMALQATKEKLNRRIFLFYSNRRPEDAPFLQELGALKNPNYTLIATMTDEPAGSWRGETGYINKEMLARYLPELNGPMYYAAGPEGLVKAMQKMLTEAGVSAANIRTEEFSGY